MKHSQKQRAAGKLTFSSTRNQFGLLGQRGKLEQLDLLPLCFFFVGFLSFSMYTQATANTPPQHPLDPLTAQEYLSVQDILNKAGHADAASRYPLITLEEPAKATVLTWQPGKPFPRRAGVVVKKGRRTFEAVVDLNQSTVLTWQEIKGVEPGVLLTEEWQLAQELVRSHPDWKAAMRRRGIGSFYKVVCMPYTVGYHDLQQEKGKRLLKVNCYDGRKTKNFWGRPIEGIIITVDLHTQEVVEVIDTGVVPIPVAPADFTSPPSEKEAPQTTSSQDPSSLVRVHGNLIQWRPWEFHLRIDPRLGPILSLVRFHTKKKGRLILYQGSLSELFVPYMDPDAGWYFKAYMDAGEYGVGKLATQLEPGLDCPADAVFLDAVFASEWGAPYPNQRIACLFERDTGTVAWRHYEATNKHSAGRTRSELVVRLTAVVGNYDYVFDWVFRQNGTIKVSVGATGVEQVKAVKSRALADATAEQDTAYGRMVAEHTVAVNHDHFFSFRLDLDVDGQRNSFRIDRLKTQPVQGLSKSPRKSVWVVDPTVVATEDQAKLRIDMEQPTLWRVVNPNEKGPVGYPVSYQLQPKTNTVPLLSPHDFPQQRAGFTDFHLWVTPYQPRERYAAGRYPNQSKGGDGLPRWTKANRVIQNTDIVLWYTLGFHHVVRAEDWPVLPTTSHGFELRPFDFFPRNPTLDLAK